MSDASLRADVRDAYAASAEAWSGGPSRVYRRLADALVACAPSSLDGHLVADVGAGTGTVTEALRAAGARVVAIDMTWEMLREHRSTRPPCTTGDVMALPLAAASVDDVAAGFVLNHLEEPAGALAEMARVVRAGGAVLASTFGEQARHPAKTVVDDVAAAHGFETPAWYAAFKDSIEGRTATPERLTRCAERAGLTVLRIHDELVDIGADDPATIADYRLSMAHLAPFLTGLDPEARQRLTADVVAALGDGVPPLRPRVLALVARRPDR